MSEEYEADAGYDLPDMHSVFRSQMRTLKHNLPSTLTIAQWDETIRFFHALCVYCCSTHYQTLDHFIPVIRGGGTTKGNCVPACDTCNQEKGELVDIITLIALFGAAHIYRVQTYLQQWHSPQEGRDAVARMRQQCREKTLLDFILVQYTTIEEYAKASGMPVKRVRNLATGAVNSVLKRQELAQIACSLHISQESVRELLYGRI